MAFSLQILSDDIKLLLCVFRHNVTSNIIFVQGLIDLKSVSLNSESVLKLQASTSYFFIIISIVLAWLNANFF